MLTSEVKQRIDNARDILVGKIPDPKGQIDQITNALIYKLMDDRDLSSKALPKGKAVFFTNGLEDCAWHKLFDSKLDNTEKAEKYLDGLNKLSSAKDLPELFRDIFKNALLPFRDPDTVALFINKINKFDCSHSEELGNAFEYLLQIMGTQGDAGQFRTPRNIIEFIVDIVNPSRSDTILDPACGTAGFLIEAYKHITEGGKLKQSELQKLAKNISGFDIDPGMAKIARVNLYLHGFKTPHIDEADTLSNEKLWGKKYDVILANPPFMSPTGAIVPHDKFNIESNKTEVLFTNYIVEHLKLKGRAGIIVPEGVLDTNYKGTKKLREMLVSGSSLWAVVSLPAGVFKPYAGVKTSILLLDKELASKNDKILFCKIENDGFALGDKRTEIAENDLPSALKVLKQWQKNQTLKNPSGKKMAHVVSKKEIAKNDGYSLNGDIYLKGADYSNVKWPMVELGEVTEIISGQSPEGKYYNEKQNGLPFYQGKTEFGKIFIKEAKKWTSKTTKVAEKNDILMSVRAPVGPVNFATEKICIGRGLASIRGNSRINQEFLFYLLQDKEKDIQGNSGATFASINRSGIQKIKIPLPLNRSPRTNSRRN